MDDISPRAVSVLKAADCIACEDTRSTALLISGLKIPAKLFAYHDFNKKEASENIINLLKQGKNVALVSDAGTPCISDPGYMAVKRAREEGIEVTPVPGACAFVSALSVSGFASDRFIFQGFLANGSDHKRRTKLKELMGSNMTVILYEAPHRICKLLGEIGAEDPDAEVFIGREITKKYEQFLTGKPAELGSYFDEVKPRGEFVVIINKKEIKEEMDRDQIAAEYAKIVGEGMEAKEAMKAIAARTGLAKSEVYKIVKIKKS
jgi:16S rRNA (cytidine1402-2'-O)-methyltransferase